MKVIVIDDEPVHVRGIMKYVNWSKFGFEKVVGAYSSKEAFKMLQKEIFDLVITDINMPEINGLELIQKINVLGRHPDIMIVSGYNEFTYAQEAIRLGVCAYILKPLKPEEIEDNIMLLAEKKKRWGKEESGFEVFKEIKREDGVIIGEDIIKQIHPSIQKILLYIAKNYSSEITVQEIADEFQINESYLSVLFKKEVGTNLSSYLQRYRLFRAMELIKNSDLRINEIAYRVGYQNPCYFTELFKKIYNKTPTEIRKAEVLNLI